MSEKLSDEIQDVLRTGSRSWADLARWLEKSKAIEAKLEAMERKVHRMWEIVFNGGHDWQDGEKLRVAILAAAQEDQVVDE